mgnify:CR=1 FL=1
MLDRYALVLQDLGNDMIMTILIHKSIKRIVMFLADQIQFDLACIGSNTIPTIPVAISCGLYTEAEGCF